MNLIIDNRERKIIKELENKIPNEYDLQNLDVGDFLYKINDNPYMIIERKTVDDLSSSIKDGRYKEQKIRLINEKNKNIIILLLIEGNIDIKTGGIPKSTLNSVVINSMVRDGIYVYNSKDINDTCNTIIKIKKLIEKNGIQLFKPIINNSVDYVSCIKKNKKENMTPKVCYLNQLSQIPGVSTGIAEKIFEKHNTMLDLIRELEIEEGDTIQEIRYGKSQKKIGTVVAKRIYEYLCKADE